MSDEPVKAHSNAVPRAVLFGSAAAVLAIVAVGALTLGGEEFDYAALDEAGQQRALDEMAAGLQFGLVRATRGAVAVRGVKADAKDDSLSLAAQFTPPIYEEVSDADAADMVQSLYAENCNAYATRKVIEGGVSVRFSVTRPSGRALIDVVFDQESCAAYLRPAVG